ncbi:MAG: glycosyltransferase family 1 protein [bacterium]
MMNSSFPGQTHFDSQPISRVIGIDIRKFHDFGIGTYIRHLIHGLSIADPKPGIEYRLFTDKNAHFSKDDFDPTRFQFSKINTSRRSPFQGALAHSNQLSIFHAPHYLAPSCSPAPLVLTVHDCIHLRPPEQPRKIPRFGGFYSNLMTQTKRIYHRQLASSHFLSSVMNATEIITVSNATARDLVKFTGIEPDKITKIYNCLDDIFFQTIDTVIIRDFCESLHLPCQEYVLYCGNDLYHKNLAALLLAWQDLTKRFSPPCLVLAGPPRPDIIRRYAEKLGIDKHIMLLSRLSRSQMPLLYKGALCLVLPSLAEGFGLPVIEAMVCGTPVACSDLPVLREISGEQATFFNPYDPLDISEKLAAVIAWPKDVLQQAQSAKTFAERYSLASFISQHEQVYNRVLEAAR